MNVIHKPWGVLYETDLLILGTGASGMGAALKAAPCLKPYSRL